MRHRPVHHATVLLTVALLTGCGSGSGGSSSPTGPATGTLSVGLTDARVDDVQELRLYLTGLTVKRDGAGPQTLDLQLEDCTAFPAIEPDCNPIDLLELQDGLVLTVLQGQEMLAGRYQWLRLDVDSAKSYVVEDSGGVADVEVRVPSERGLQLSGGFVILANQRTDLLMDWDARQGLTHSVGRNDYIVKPSIRLTDLAEYGAVGGAVSDSIMMNECLEGGVVYVFEGELAAVDLDDIDNNDPNPLVTAPVNQADNGSFGYRADFLPPGAYTVALTCEAQTDASPATEAADDADDVIAFSAPQTVSLSATETATVDF